MNDVYKKRCEDYCRNALEQIKKAKKLHLILGHVEIDDELSKIFLTDGKLLDAKCGPNSFKVTFASNLYEDNFCGIDDLAGIPSNADLPTKIILRIAYYIWSDFDNNRLDAFTNYIKSLPEEERWGPKTMPSRRNAKNWYKKL